MPDWSRADLMKLRRFEIKRCLLLAGLLFGIYNVAMGSRISEPLSDLLSDLPKLPAPGGILYDRVLPLSEPERFSGGPASPPVSLAIWRQIAFEIRAASVETESLPARDTILAETGEALRSGKIPIAILDYQYHQLNPEVFRRGDFEISDGRLSIGSETPYLNRPLFAVTSLQEFTYQGRQVRFEFPEAFYFGN